MGVYAYIKIDGKMFFHSPALVSCGRISFSGAVTLAVGMISSEGIFYHFVFFYPFFSFLSPECREGSAEGLSLRGGRPARISSSLFCSFWSVSTCGILRPLAQLPVPHGRGHEAIAAFSGLNLRPGSEKLLGPTALSACARSFPRLSALL